MSDVIDTAWRRTGDRIHWGACRYGHVDSSVPWNLVAGWDKRCVRNLVAASPWLSFCKRCVVVLPDGAIATKEANNG